MCIRRDRLCQGLFARNMVSYVAHMSKCGIVCWTLFTCDMVGNVALK